MTTIPCCDLAFSSLAELCVVTKFLCSNTVSVSSHFDSHSDNFSGLQVFVSRPQFYVETAVFPFTKFGVVTTIPCHDTISVVIQFDSWSQPPFHVATSFLVFCLHASCDSKLLICLFSCHEWELCRDKVVSFLTSIPVTTSKACRDRSFFQSCRYLIFLVTTVSTQFSLFFLS